MRRIDLGERRARLAWRHRLAGEAKAGEVTDAVRGVVALHATDPASVYLAAAARLRRPEETVPALERALYEDRTVMRMMGMRRTLFVVPDELVAVVQRACAGAIAEKRHRQLAKLVEDGGIAEDGEAWVAEVRQRTRAALAARGAAFGAELSADVPSLREKISYGEGRKWASTTNLTTFVLVQLGLEGVMVRGRPRGTWNSSQYRWAPVEAWLPDGIADIPVDDARVALVRAWLAAFGPGTVADVVWWTGLTATQVKRALARIEPVEVDLDGGSGGIAGTAGTAGTGLVLADDLDPTPPPEPWVALLPALDPTSMGWTGRDWFLGEHRSVLFDRSGNIGPTVWCDGRIVGGWAQRRGGPSDGEVVVRLLEDVGGDASAAVAAEAERLTAWFGDVRIVPRFRTPLERELSA